MTKMTLPWLYSYIWHIAIYGIALGCGYILYTRECRVADKEAIKWLTRSV